ncbi:hypothetical protein RQP46_008013 [Phenoliferia psychrophenolica]
MDSSSLHPGLSAYYGPTDDEQSKITLRKALEIGCTVWNSADMYAKGANEILLGEVLKEPGVREKVFLITKWGNRWTGLENTTKLGGATAAVSIPSSSIDASIARMQGITPDAWINHRVDKSVPIEETVGAMEKARKEGKCKYIGLSECSAETLRKASAVAKIHFVEIEYSPFTTDIESNGVLAAAAELGVIILAYSPLGRGMLTGAYKKLEDFGPDNAFRASLPRMQGENFAKNYKLVEELEKIAVAKGCTPGQLSLAWLMAQPGTKSEKYVVENFAARDVKLSTSELAEIRKVIEANKPVGDRPAESRCRMTAAAGATESTPLLAGDASQSPVAAATSKQLISPFRKLLLTCLMLSIAFIYTATPLIYAFRTISCDNLYADGTLPPYEGDGDRCANHEVESKTASSISVMVTLTTFSGVLNLISTGYYMRRWGVRMALVLQTLIPLTANTYVAALVLPEDRTASFGIIQGVAMAGTALGYTPSGGGIWGFLTPLKVFLPRKIEREDGGDGRLYWGLTLLGTGTFMGVLAVAYVPLMLQLTATNTYGFKPTQNGYLLSTNATVRAVFLTALFPRIIARGRLWYTSRSAGALPPGVQTPPLGTHAEDFEPPSVTGEATEPILPPSPTDQDHGSQFDLLFVRCSMVLDGLLTGCMFFADEGWHMYLAATLIPFASGTAPASKGVIMDMVPADQQPDALSAIALAEMLATVITVSIFGILFAALSELGLARWTFLCNAGLAMLAASVLCLDPHQHRREGNHYMELGLSSASFSMYRIELGSAFTMLLIKEYLDLASKTVDPDQMRLIERSMFQVQSVGGRLSELPRIQIVVVSIPGLREPTGIFDERKDNRLLGITRQPFLRAICQQIWSTIFSWSSNVEVSIEETIEQLTVTKAVIDERKRPGDTPTVADLLHSTDPASTLQQDYGVLLFDR